VEPRGIELMPMPTPILSLPGEKVELYGDEEIILSFCQANDQKVMDITLINNNLWTIQLEI
jgi:hypothetical protein